MRDVKRLEVFGLAVFAGLLVPTVLLGQLNLVEHISDSSATPLRNSAIDNGDTLCYSEALVGIWALSLVCHALVRYT